ncbi:uncharacterized protein [Nicotiana tomentosiformis]|uniref:uncharacterized protein n=1 Tax=Nicotiana tomentosiformis TaxID=4098 RepID=UPI00388C806C
MGKRYFKFLNCSVESEKCLPLVEEVWNREVTGNLVWVFHQKLKSLSKALSIWSRQKYGDIFQKAKLFEQQVKDAEEAWAQRGTIREDILSCILTMITPEENNALSTYPTMNELKEVAFSMSPTSVAGPDGMNGKFYQACTEIIKFDLMKVVLTFFEGSTMPRYMTSVCLVLLPILKFPNSLTQFRPINLSNFINKIISKIISTRLAPILPRIISGNQIGFVRGRNISENIMLAQEIIHGIKKPNISTNVVIKLNMSKAYDRVSWSFTCIMLRRMGFCERIIDMIWRTLPNNWMLNNLNHDQFFNDFYMQRRGPQINHLSFADDIIISTSGGRSTIRRIRAETGFSKRKSPLTYLGYPLYIGRKRIIHYNNLIPKIIVSPPKTVMKQIDKLVANFFQGLEKDKLKYHWASWQKLAYTMMKGGLGFRTIEDVYKSMEIK